jgi:hypothetical protein
MADRVGLKFIGLVMASLTAGVILIAAVLVYRSATSGLLADHATPQSSRLLA